VRAPKVRNVKAQGNALGKGIVSIKAPKGHDNYPKAMAPLRGIDRGCVVYPRALPWALTFSHLRCFIAGDQKKKAKELFVLRLRFKFA
jgi:hypothetical protein